MLLRKVQLFTLLCLLVLPVQAIAGLVVINFDDLPQGGITGVVVTNQYPQATFSSTSGFVNYVTTQSQYNGTPPNFICTGPIGGSINCTEPTIVNFTSPVSDLTFQGMGVNDTGVVAQVDVYVSGVFAQTVNIMGAAQGFNPDLVDLSAFSNVTEINIHNITDGGGIGWDTFTFQQNGTSTPEPASVGLALAGLAGLIALARRSSRARS